MAENLTRISRLGIVNCFLVREDDGLTLVDTMLKGSAKRILAAAEEAGAPIVRIVLTHYHDDHSGSLDALAEALPEAEVMWPARETPFMRGEAELEPGEPEGKVRAIKPVKAEPARELNGGDRVGSLEAIASPGHSPGHLALPRHPRPHADRGRRLLDARRGRDDRRAVLALPAARASSPGTARSSSNPPRRCARSSPRAWPSGHGKTVDDPLAAMDAAIAKRS